MEYRLALGSLPEKRGWVLRAQQGNGVRFSEVAVFEQRGTESFEQASEYLKALPMASWPVAPKELPACRFGLAALDPARPQGSKHTLALCQLMGPHRPAPSPGVQHIKVKIGQQDPQAEQEALKPFLDRVKSIRLDANGQCNVKTAMKWLHFAQKTPKIAFLEQLLPVGQESTLAAMARDTSTPLALDESLCQPFGVERALDAHWPGLFAIKPSILGLDFPASIWPHTVLSCAHESVFGLSAWMALAEYLPLNFPVGLPQRCLTPQGLELPWPCDGAADWDLEAVWEGLRGKGGRCLRC